MKKAITGFLSFLLLFSGFAQADFINVLSQEYSIEGYIYAHFYQPDYHSLYLSYQETSSFPVFHDLNNLGLGPYSTGLVWSIASANGGVTSEYALVESRSTAGDKGGGPAYASASSSITFSPLVSTMLVSAEWSGLFWEGEANLIDLTSGSTLYSRLPQKQPGTEDIIISFDPSHIYSMNAVTSMNWNSSEYVSLRIQSIPEPSTLLLLGAGIVGIVGFRRKFRK